MWIIMALCAALCTGTTYTLSKAGLKNIDPSVGTAIQAVSVMVFVLAVVACQGKISEVRSVDPKTWGFLLASGVVSTGSYLLINAALKIGPAAQVQPLERLSLVIGIILAWFFLREKITLNIIIGAVLMAGGALVIAWKQ